jgi:hypothetical protein
MGNCLSSLDQTAPEGRRRVAPYQAGWCYIRKADRLLSVSVLPEDPGQDELTLPNDEDEIDGWIHGWMDARMDENA